MQSIKGFVPLWRGGKFLQKNNFLKDFLAEVKFPDRASFHFYTVVSYFVQRCYETVLSLILKRSARFTKQSEHLLPLLKEGKKASTTSLHLWSKYFELVTFVKK